MKEVIIHAGLHKTGSTSIQRTLFYNQQILKRNGYQFLNIETPDGKKLKNHSNVIINLFRDNPEDHYINKKFKWDADKVKQHYDRHLSNTLKKLGKDKLLISGEGISSLNENGLERLKDYFSDFNIRIIIFVRDPYEAMCSRLQEGLSKGAKNGCGRLAPRAQKNSGSF